MATITIVPPKKPWEQFSSPDPTLTKPWEKYGAPAEPVVEGPWNEFQTERKAPPLEQITGAPDPWAPKSTTPEQGPMMRRSGEGWKYGFGSTTENPIGISPKNLEKHPSLYGLQPLAYPADFLMRSLSGTTYGLAGLAAGGYEKATGDEAGANRLQRDLGIIPQYVDPAIGSAVAYQAAKRVPAAQRAGQTVEKVLSPETVDPAAKQAVTSIREASGQAARDTAAAETAFTASRKPFMERAGGATSRLFSGDIKGAADKLFDNPMRRIAAMPHADRLNLIDYVENRSGRYSGLQMIDPEMQALANDMRTQFTKRMTKLQNLPSTAQASFIEDYYPHFWKDPQAAQAFVEKFGGGSRQGSGASLKKRTMPTIADGIAAGLEPVTTNPIEATMRYVSSMDRFIANTEVLDTAKANGTIRFFSPRVMGASGHPTPMAHNTAPSGPIPPDWVPLKGRGATNASGQQAYAPSGWARIYNNWVDRGIHDWAGEAGGQIYDAARMATNSITMAELSFSGYHAMTVAKEGIHNGVTQAVKQLRTGHPIKAAKTYVKSITNPVGYAMEGKKLQNVYLGLAPGTAENRQLADLLTAAGGRAKGSAHAPDVQVSKASNSYFTSLRRGQLRLELAADLKDVQGRPILGTAAAGARHIGRIIKTVSQPLFEKYIPLAKNGAYMENMSAWLAEHPQATREQQVNAARQILDSIDNRFGEMVQDNVFWGKTSKQAAMLMLRSWSWAIGGDVREMGGAMRDFARAPTKQVHGIGPNDTRWTQKMDYMIAMPLTYAPLAAMYQYLKTGQGPEDMQDLKAPRTGGTDARTGQPERLIMPGLEKDVFGFMDHPVQEGMNKIGTAPKMAGQLLTNSDWRGDPIFSPAEEGMSNVPVWLGEFAKFIAEGATPIQMRDLAKGKMVGSNLNAGERLMGVRTAPRSLVDPEGTEHMLEGMAKGRWRKKMRHDQRQQGLYEQ